MELPARTIKTKSPNVSLRTSHVFSETIHLPFFLLLMEFRRLLGFPAESSYISSLLCMLGKQLSTFVSSPTDSDRVSDRPAERRGAEEASSSSRAVRRDLRDDAGVEPVGGAHLPGGPASSRRSWSGGHSADGCPCTLLQIRLVLQILSSDPLFWSRNV